MTVADVKNTPRTLTNGYMVARAVDGELWYYGTYPEKDRADSVAVEIGNGVVLKGESNDRSNTQNQH